MDGGVRRCCWGPPSPSTGLTIECVSCHRCGPQNGWQDMEEAILAVTRQPLHPRTEDWVHRSIAWARCSSLGVYRAEQSAKDATKRLREARAETAALRTVAQIFRKRIELTEQWRRREEREAERGDEVARSIIGAIEAGTANLAAVVREVERELNSRERTIEVSGGKFVKRALMRADRDVFSDVDVRLNKKHALDPLVFECVTLWPAITGDEHRRIGRPNSERPPPFQRFLIAAARPLVRPLGLTRNSLCDRARFILGRRLED